MIWKVWLSDRDVPMFETRHKSKANRIAKDFRRHGFKVDVSFTKVMAA